METLTNQILRRLKTDSTIEVDRQMQTVFVEMEEEGFYVHLPTSPIFGSWDLEIYMFDEKIIDSKVIEKVSEWIQNYCTPELGHSNTWSNHDRFNTEMHSTFNI